MTEYLQSQDWPYLNRYQTENDKLSPLKLGEKRIVFMGDSITELWSVVHPSFFSEKSYINRGIGGQTSPQMLVRFRADVIALKPSVVVLLAGANDIAQNTGPSTLEMIANNIFSMVELATANNIKVILSSVLPVFDFYWRQGLEPAGKIVTLNKMISEYAYTNAIPYVDYYSAMVDEQKGLKSIFSEDGVHPNKAGYEVMITLAHKAIRLALK